MRHVFVETNWLVGYAAPAHHQMSQAPTLLERAAAKDVRLYLPALCLNEARRTIKKFQPRREADAIRQFLAWSKGRGKITDDDAQTALRIVSMFEAKVKNDLARIDDTFASLRKHEGIEIVPLDDEMLSCSIDLSSDGSLDLQPFDQAVLAAVLVRAKRLRAAGETDISFCQLDGDLQPWDKKGNPRPALKHLYDSIGIWVYGDFDLSWPVPDKD